MRSRSNGGVIGAFAYPTQSQANGVFFIHDAAIFNTGANPIWPLASGLIYNATGGTITYNGNYKIHTFTANGTFTIIDGAAPLEILVVGSGGHGGCVSQTNTTSLTRTGGGGGGGGVVLVSTFANNGTTFAVTVGKGALPFGSTGAATHKVRSNNSSVLSNMGHSYTALAGQMGWGVTQTAVGDVDSNLGGSSGGTSSSNGSAYANTSAYAAGQPISAWGGYGTKGGGSLTSYNSTYGVYANLSGGGGGAAEAGYDGGDTRPIGPYGAKRGHGGDGWYWDRTGKRYGAGGGGGFRRRAGESTSAYCFGGASGDTADKWLSTYGGAYGIEVYETNGTNSGNAGMDFYGQGGGGACMAVTTNNYSLGGKGGDGTVIFCYRYK